MPIYMHIREIPGDSTAEGYENWFDVFSFSWGENMPANTTGGITGRIHISDFNVMKRSGRGSPQLMLACASGRQLPAVQLVITTENEGRPMVLESWMLTHAALKSYQIGADGDGAPVESLSLNFTRIEFSQTYFNSDGQPTTQTAFWDLRSNTGG